VEAYPFVTIDSVGGVVSVQTNDMTKVGFHTVTFRASLANYLAVPPAQLTIGITLVDPCLTTVLALPTTLVSFTIAAFDGIGFTQTFMPATDTAATSALVPELCGPRVYTILEATPASFISITAPVAGQDYTAPWTLLALSNNFMDAGSWTTTLQVTLLNYPTILAATKVMNSAVCSIDQLLWQHKILTGTEPYSNYTANLVYTLMKSGLLKFYVPLPVLPSPRTECEPIELQLQDNPTWAKLQKDPSSDFYFIEVLTEDLSLVGPQTLTLQASFTNFPTAGYQYF